MKQNISSRWLVLAAILANVLFNAIWASLFQLSFLGETMQGYTNFFIPAPYAFTIWILIYTGMIAYGIYQVTPGQRYVPVHDRISAPLIAVNLLNIAWAWAFTLGIHALSALLVVLMLVFAIVVYMRTGDGIQKWGYRPILSLPFSLFTGWLCVMAIANVFLFLNAVGWKGGMLGEEAWAIAMMGALCLLGIIFNYKYLDVIYPFVVVWALVAIWIRYRHDNTNIAGAACVISALLLLWTSVYSLSTTRNRIKISHQHH